MNLQDIIATHPELERLASSFPQWQKAVVAFFNDQESGIHAMGAIKILVAMELPIPRELERWIHEAISEWENVKGRKGKVKAGRTQAARREAVFQVGVLLGYGLKMDEVCEKVRREFPKFSRETLDDYRKRSAYAAERDRGKRIGKNLRDSGIKPADYALALAKSM